MDGVTVGKAVRPGAQLFAGMHSAFLRAARQRPGAYHEECYRFADHDVRLRVIGRTLIEPLRTPFVHLQDTAGSNAAPRLVIDAWEPDITDVEDLDAPPSDAAATWTIDGGLLTSCAGGRLVRYRHGASTMWLDRQVRHIVSCHAAAGPVGLDERSKPFAMLLAIWYGDRGVQVVHAGLVARADRGVLVAGPSRSGKSLVTLACLDAGFDVLGDDHVGLQRSPDGSFMGHSLYGSARLHPRVLARLPSLAAHVVTDDGDAKALLLLSPYRRQLRRRASIQALALPCAARRATARIRRATPGEALRRLAPSSLMMPFGAGGAGFARLAEMVQRVPAYWLEVGRDVTQVPRDLEAILARTSEHAGAVD